MLNADGAVIADGFQRANDIVPNFLAMTVADGAEYPRAIFYIAVDFM